MQDPFNTLSTWRFPYIASELAPGPAASPLIDGGLEHQVIGLSAYAFLDDSIYAELGGYKSLSRSFLNKVNIEDEAGRIDNWAPYWRLGYFKDLRKQAFSVGIFGLKADLQPDRQSGPTNDYQDIGIDASYQFLGNREHIFTLNGSFTHERQKLNAAFDAGEAARKSLDLDRLDLSASYFFQQTYGFTLAHFQTHGDADPLLYAPEADSGSRNGKPDSTGWILQADWTPFGKETSWGAPWANLRLGVQYTAYNKFNGGGNNYDGFGRDAADNNTLFLFGWTTF